jgi:choline dehydrogenase
MVGGMSTDSIPRAVDTIIIGGGTAGAAVAGRLAARTDQSVLLVEAGPDYGLRSAGRWPAELLDATVVADSHDWGYTSAARTGKPNHPLQRARVIGGCSAHNGCIAVRGSRSDYDGWSNAGNDGWSADELIPFFAKAESALRVRNFAATEVTPFHHACLDAMANIGLPLSHDLNDLDGEMAAGTAPVNIHDGTRWNTALAYLDPVRGNGYLTVIGDALVNKIRVVNGRATVVDFFGPAGAAKVDVGRVIVCAGVYGSPAVLMRSGVGSADELRTLGIATTLDLPGVGRNLHDHPVVNLQYSGAGLFSAMDAFVANGHTPFTEQSLVKARSDACSVAYDLHVYPFASAIPTQQGRWECFLPVANLTPRSRGTFRLRSMDPTEKPTIDTGYLTDPNDEDLTVLMSGIELARQIASQQPLANLIGKESPISAECIRREDVRRSCVHYYHPVGTCKMGPISDPEAVVDASGRVHGTDNIFVADASIMPTIPRANTNLPALMIAERTVDRLI